MPWRSGNALPGPIAPQVSAFVGYKLAGIPGAVAAVAGTVLPTTILMLLMIVFFFSVKDSPAVKLCFRLCVRSSSASCLDGL